MEIIQTKRLILRSLCFDDCEAAMNFWGNSNVMKYCGGACKDINQINNVIRNYTKSLNERGFSAYAVSLKDSGDVIGACGFNYTSKFDEIELIYHFSEKYWGKGYASEASKACIEYARKNLNVSKIIASTDPENEVSGRILKKLGFKYMGLKWFEDTHKKERYYELNIVEECGEDI